MRSSRIMLTAPRSIATESISAQRRLTPCRFAGVCTVLTSIVRRLPSRTPMTQLVPCLNALSTCCRSTLSLNRVLRRIAIVKKTPAKIKASAGNK